VGRDAGSRLRPSVRRSPRRRGTMQSLNHGNGGASSAPSPYACRHCFGTARVAPAVKPSEAAPVWGAGNQPTVRPSVPPPHTSEMTDETSGRTPVCRRRRRRRRTPSPSPWTNSKLKRKKSVAAKRFRRRRQRANSIKAVCGRFGRIRASRQGSRVPVPVARWCGSCLSRHE
jgi:hypothetical protein